jgi:nitroimidazol reductase NimA-like FMN-containing flavoprotein (pyridoxamine 5'-phosphate oxidase superfamily)
MAARHRFRDTGEMPIFGTIRFEEIPPEDCLILLDLAHVGRIGVSVQALPVILPVNYVVHEGDVVFRTSSGTKLAAATAGAVVAFEVDHHDAHGTRGWSVLLQGRAEEIIDPVQVAQARILPLHSWALDGGADHYVRLRPTMISGRRFQPVGLTELLDETIN